MEHPGFFERAAPSASARLAARSARELAQVPIPTLLMRDVKPLAEAGRGDLSFFDNRKYLPPAAGDPRLGLPGGACNSPRACPRALRAGRRRALPGLRAGAAALSILTR